ncbi:unnamed protein product [Malus baccata var. baccata]
MACGIGPEVLNQNNYTPWSMRIKTYLVAKDLWDVVQTEHPEVGPSDKHKVWKQRNAQALHAIQLSCGDDILSFISDATSAKSAWDILLDKFEIHRRFFKDKTRHGVDDSYLGPLFSDVWRGDWKAAKAFLDQNPEAIGKVYSKDGGTIIHSAILFKRFDIVKELLQWMREEDLAITDQHGCTPLIYAINQGSIEIVENMIEMNKNIAAMRIPPDNMTPVLYAFSLGFNEIARKLYKVTPPEELTCGPNEGRDGAELISSCFYAQSFGTYPSLTLTIDILQAYPFKCISWCTFCVLMWRKTQFLGTMDL